MYRILIEGVDANGIITTIKEIQIRQLEPGSYVVMKPTNTGIYVESIEFSHDESLGLERLLTFAINAIEPE